MAVMMILKKRRGDGRCVHGQRHTRDASSTSGTTASSSSVWKQRMTSNERRRRLVMRTASTSSQNSDVQGVETVNTTRTKEANAVPDGVRADEKAVKTEKEEEEGGGEEELREGYLPVLSVQELPRGERKVVELPDGSGQEVLLLWYRGQVRCIENRSPAEGAYSEGLFKARFTQNSGIVCPTTGSVFSLETGEVIEWFPDNPVLAQLTPKSTARPLEVFPVQLKGDEETGVVCVNPESGSIRRKSGGQRNYGVRRMSGGFGTSIEDNNVFGVEPEMYLEGTEPGTPIAEESDGNAEGKISPATVLSGTVAVAIVAVAGSATALYYESLPALAALWIALFGGAAYATYSYLKQEGDI